jgi:hypothetical protein
MYSPVYILASERSGTNLLRKLVTKHQNIYYGGAPAHLLKHLFYKEPYYGDLSENSNFIKLINDALSLTKEHFSPWQIDWIDNDILNEFDSKYDSCRGVVLLSHFMMEKYAQEQGFQSYICKDNDIFEFVDAIVDSLPDTKFIYLHRDPRDVAASQYLRTLQTNSLVRISALWRYEQIRCISLLCRFKDRIHRVSYENLIVQPNIEIQNICSFLKISYSEDQNQSEVSHGYAKEWSNLNRPVMMTNSKNYVKVFSQRQVALIESMLQLQMQYLGYILEKDNNKVSKYYKIFDFFWGEFSALYKMKIHKDNNDQWFKSRSVLLKKIAIKWKNQYF